MTRIARLCNELEAARDRWRTARAVVDFTGHRGLRRWRFIVRQALDRR